MCLLTSYKTLEEETADDETLRQLVHAGRPDRRSQIPRNIQDYWNYREEITCYDGIIFKGGRIIVPQFL